MHSRVSIFTNLNVANSEVTLSFLICFSSTFFKIFQIPNYSGTYLSQIAKKTILVDFFLTKYLPEELSSSVDRCNCSWRRWCRPAAPCSSSSRPRPRWSSCKSVGILWGWGRAQPRWVLRQVSWLVLGKPEQWLFRRSRVSAIVKSL